jgi:hypothetical protein
MKDLVDCCQHLLIYFHVLGNRLCFPHLANSLHEELDSSQLPFTCLAGTWWTPPGCEGPGESGDYFQYLLQASHHLSNEQYVWWGGADGRLPAAPHQNMSDLSHCFSTIVILTSEHLSTSYHKNIRGTRIRVA